MIHSHKIISLPSTRSKHEGAFSMLEVLIVVSVLATVSSLGIGLFTRFDDQIKKQKLDSELATLNCAVSAYIAFGGDLSSIDDPEVVISKLKTVAAKELTNRLPGLSQSMLDSRVEVIFQSSAEASGNAPRIYWNSSKGRFEMSHSGGIGIKKLILSEIPQNEISGDARESIFLYAGTSNWVWDYGAETPVSYLSPTNVAVSSVPPGSSPSILPPSVVPPVSSAQKLQSPEFTKDPGTYSILEYPMLLEITNPNPPGSSNIQYSVDYGPWQNYTRSFTVPPGSVVQTQAVTTDYTIWMNSSMVRADYAASPVRLVPPSLDPSAPAFGAFSDNEVFVSLTDNNSFEYPTALEFRVNGGSWNTYTNDFSLDRADHPDGALVEARAVSSSIYFESSETVSAFIEYEPLFISASSNGEFTNPDGPLRMVTNLNSQTPASSYFEWGSVVNPAGKPVSRFSESSLEFAGGNGAGTLGQQIYLGSLEYFNGTIFSGTGADSVDLIMDLTLQIGGENVFLNFDFGFNLINVLNNGNAHSSDRGEAMVSADFVQIDNNSHTSFFEIEGLQFSLDLEFGVTSGDGFGSFDEFHVLEDRDASTQVYGTIEMVSQ